MAEDRTKDIKYVPMVIENSRVPKGAVRLSQKEILDIQRQRLKRCKSVSEISAFRFAPHFLGASTALTAFAVTSHFRLKFQLRNLGMVFSYGPCVVLPTIVTTIGNQILSEQVLLQPDCKECLQVRSGVFQVATSVLYSFIFSPIISILLSRKFFTYRDPRFGFEPNLFHAFKSSAYNRGCLAALMAVNFALGAFVRYKQDKQLENLMAKELDIDQQKLLEELRD